MSGAATLESMDYLQYCFFIYDDYHYDERAKDEDLMIYFYPSSVDIKKRLQLMGSCDAMITFANQFTKSPARVIEMKKFKITFKIIGSFIVALTAPPECSRHALVSQLDLLMGAFQFFNKNLQTIKDASPNRREFQQNVTKACGPLTPLLAAFHGSPLQQFHPMPYTDLRRLHNPRNLSQKSNTRFFVVASQILSALSRHEKVLGGCIVYDSGVLCTHLDLASTRFITSKLTWFDCKQILAVQPRLVSGVHMPSDIVIKLHQELKRANPPLFQVLQGEEGLVKMSLNLFKVGNVFVGVVAYTDSDDAVGALWNVISPLVTNLDRSLKQANEQTQVPDVSEQAGPQGVASPLRSSPTADQRRATLVSPLQRSGSIGRSPRNSPKNSAADIKAPAASSPSPSSSPTPDTRPLTAAYNLLYYEELTQAQTIHFGLKKLPDYERTFMRTVALAHDQFTDDQKITKLVFRDHLTTIFCRKLFGKETYFQVANNASFRHSEDIARDTLASFDKGVTLV